MKKLREIESEEEQPQRRNTKTKGYARSYAVTEKWFKAMVVAATTMSEEVEAGGEMVVVKNADVERGLANWWPENNGHWSQYCILILAVVGLFQVCRWILAGIRWIQEFLCEKRCGTKGCCKKRENTAEKDQEETVEVRGAVYITVGGKCFHRFENCHTLQLSKAQRREPCKFCERELVKFNETAAFLMKGIAKDRKELESKVAHTERKLD